MTVPVISLRLAKPGVELVLEALVKLPYEQSAGLIREIEAQANYQLELMRKAAEASAQPAAEPVPETAKDGD